MDIKIEKADERHRRDINRLMRSAKIGCLGKNEPIKNFWFVRHGGRVIACAGLDFYGSDVAILTSIVVERELRHHGIGSQLIAHRMKVAKDRGAKILAFVTMYYHFNFYKRRGFRTCPRADLPESIRDYWMFTAKRYKKCAVMYQYVR